MDMQFYNVRIGAHPICWTNDDLHDLGDFISFERLVDEAALAGYAGVELGRKFPRDPEVLKRALGERGLVLSSGWSDVLTIDKGKWPEYYEAFKKHARFLASMGCKQVIACEVGNSTCWDPRQDRRKLGPKKLDEGEWKMLASGLDQCGAFARELGMELSYHVHTGTVVESYEETERLLSLTGADKVFLLADTGHLRYCGVDIPKFYSDFFGRIRYVHLKDIREDVLKTVKEFGLDFNSSVRVGVFTVPGDGCVDYPAVFKILAAKGYQGWMVVEAEQNALHAEPLAYVTKARQYIRAQTGL
jgi:inosose dehydratase